MKMGWLQASDIIESLNRTGGVITETIKIIIHSMGAAYGQGFVRAIKEYIKTFPLALQKQCCTKSNPVKYFGIVMAFKIL